MRKLLTLALLSGCLLGSLNACSSVADTVINNQTQVLKQDPGNVSALIERGNAFREKNDYASALADHSKAIELGNSNARAYFARGLDYLALNQYEKALEDLSKALTLNPELNEAYARRGESRVRLQSEYQKAIDDFDKAQSLGFSDARMQRYRGQAYFRL
ncbi:MAG: tetratricopeptide repeat protein, partial [Candidatus Sericytochromatia bacterium]